MPRRRIEVVSVGAEPAWGLAPPSSPAGAAPRWSSARWLGLALVLLAAQLTLFELTDLDLAVQDRFFDFAAQRWVVDAREPVGRLVFYDGPKVAIIATGLALLGLGLGPARWRERARLDRRGLAVGLLVLASVPALAGWGKSTTNVFCPSEIRRYGGGVPFVKLFAPYPENDRPGRKGHCFPAGHASGGFALMGLAWVRGTRRWWRGAVGLGLVAGWWMGGYQMLKGAHYLSHTVTTMLLAWILALAWRMLVRPRREAAGVAL